MLVIFVLVADSAFLIKVVVFKDFEVRTRSMIFRLGPVRTGPVNLVPFRTTLHSYGASLVGFLQS